MHCNSKNGKYSDVDKDNDTDDDKDQYRTKALTMVVVITIIMTIHDDMIILGLKLMPKYIPIIIMLTLEIHNNDYNNTGNVNTINHNDISNNKAEDPEDAPARPRH